MASYPAIAATSEAILGLLRHRLDRRGVRRRRASSTTGRPTSSRRCRADSRCTCTASRSARTATCPGAPARRRPLPAAGPARPAFPAHPWAERPDQAAAHARLRDPDARGHADPPGRRAQPARPEPDVFRPDETVELVFERSRFRTPPRSGRSRRPRSSRRPRTSRGMVEIESGGRRRRRARRDARIVITGADE